ncbi:endonuclease domain-containing protein [Streptomyces sp. 900105755]
MRGTLLSSASALQRPPTSSPLCLIQRRRREAELAPFPLITLGHERSKLSRESVKFIITCGYCGAQVEGRRRTKKYCSPECARKARRDANAACRFESCQKPSHSDDLCQGHYRQKWEGKKLAPLRDNIPRLSKCGKYKQCYVCEERKPTAEFDSYARGDTSIVASRCKECRNLYEQARRFSLTVPELKETLSKGCHMCGSGESGSVRNLHIDHDHKCCPRVGNSSRSCGKCVRGALCHSCNLIIGHANDSIDRLRAAIRYLEKFAH